MTSEVEALRAEVERLRNPLMEVGEDGTVETFAAVLEERKALRARVAALEEYAQHKPLCPCTFHSVKPKVCTCGLAALLAPSESVALLEHDRREAEGQRMADLRAGRAKA